MAPLIAPIGLAIGAACFTPYVLPFVRQIFETPKQGVARVRREIKRDNAAGIAARRKSDMQRTYPMVPRP